MKDQLRILTDKYIVPDADIPIGPCTTILFEDLIQCLLISCSFIRLRPHRRPIDQCQLLLNLAGDHESEVHIGGLLELAAT